MSNMSIYVQDNGKKRLATEEEVLAMTERKNDKVSKRAPKDAYELMMELSGFVNFNGFTYDVDLLLIGKLSLCVTADEPTTLYDVDRVPHDLTSAEALVLSKKLHKQTLDKEIAYLDDMTLIGGGDYTLPNLKKVKEDNK